MESEKEMSLIKPMKDKIDGIRERNVPHQADEGQNRWNLRVKCPSSNR
ncbi:MULTISPECIES: hypothetical protein [Neobacillus]|uniref:Uncharacterized protein n=1 Tax=Neobacillus rhizophilus TaxID=2833579 RepID=A0A942UAJ9_9BACI|nr:MULTISPECIES: hypothetical protein [Neobacillus]MBS4215588.1 hypothetical protein [Neobacillus rhizophilus]MBU8916516.1 hypothetical protein [Bacillus sp. FJAT-29953]